MKGPARILVVDDNAAALKATVRILRQAGYEVAEASEGAEALRQVPIFRPNLMLLDVVLPDISGPEVLRQIRLNLEWVDVSIVLLSSQQIAPEQQASGLDEGADGYIVRPIANQELLARVRLHFRQRDLMDQLSASEARFRDLIARQPDGVLVVDEEGNIQFANPAAEALFGLSAVALVGSPFGLAPEEGQVQEIQLQQPDGKSALVEVNLAPTRWNGLSAWVATLRDITARKQTEAALIESSALLKVLMENTSEKIYFKDLESRFVYLSGGAVKVPHPAGTGGLKGKTDFDLFSAEFARTAFKAEQEIIRTGQALLNLEEKEIHLDGQISWVLTSKMPWHDQEGKIVGIFGISRDITERKLMEEQLQKARSELRLLFDFIPAMICFKDTENRILRANRLMAKIAGRSVEELEGRLTQEIFPEKAAKYFADDLDVIRSGEPKLGIMETVQDCEGTEFTIQTDKVPVFGEGGKVVGVVVMAQDISERMKTDEALRRGQAELRVLFDLVPAMIWFKDTENGFLRVNQRVAEATGLSIGEIEGKSAYEIFPREADAYYEDDQEVIRSGRPKLGIVEKLRGPKDEELWVRTDKVPVFAEDGKVIGLVATVFDITERKVADDELRRKTAFLEAQISSSPDGIIVVDPQGKKTFQNAQVAKLFKIPSEIAEDPNDERQVAWITERMREPEAFAEKVAHLYAHPDEVSYDEVHLNDGTILDRHSSPVLGQDGTHYGRIWTFRNITGRKQDEEALRENEERFTGAFELAPIGMALVSPDGRWTKVNQVLCRMLGYSTDELQRLTFHEITAPEDLEASLENMRRLVAGEVQSYQAEKHYLHRLGHPVPVLLNVSLVRDSQRCPRYFIAQIQDITARKNAEKALRERTQLAELDAAARSAWTQGGTLAETLKLCCEAIVRHLDGAFARVWTLNEQEEMLELQASAGLYTHLDGPHGRVPVGKFKIGLIAEERKPHLTNQVVGDPRVGDQEWAKREGMVAFAGYPLIVGGRLLGVIAMFARHPLSEGTLTALASVADNIALSIERQRWESELKESNEKFHQLADNVTDVFWVRSPDMRELHYLSPAYERIWGRPVEVLHKDPDNWVEFIVPEDRVQVVNAFNALKGDTAGIDIEYRILRPDGQERWVRARGFQVRDRDGKLIRLAGILTDINEKKLAEAELLESKRFAESIAENSTNIIYIFDLECARNIYTNRNAAEHLGYSAAQIVEMGETLLVKIMHPDDLARIRESLARLAHLKDREVVDLEYRVKHSSGEWRWMWARETVFKRRPNGAVWQIMGTAQDITYRKRDEEKLRLLGSAVEQSKEAIVITDAELNLPGPRIIFVNPAYTRMTGYTADEVMGKTPRILQGPHTDRSVLNRLSKNLEAGEEFEGETINYRKNGEEFITQWQIVPLRNSNLKITHFVAVQRDVTESRRAESMLMESRHRLALATESAQVGIWDWDVGTGKMVWDSQMFRLYGIDEPYPQATYGTWQKGLHPDDLLRSEGEIATALSGDQDFHTHFRVVWPDGEVRHVEAHGVVHRSADGSPSHMIGVNWDITLRKRAEEELFKSREKLRGILDHIPQRVFWKDRNFTFLGCNQAFAEDLGLNDPSDVIGKTDFELNSKTLAELYRADDLNVLERDTAKFNFEEPGRAADGSPMWLRTSKVPLHDQHGHVSGILGTYEDVTEARLAKQEIQKLEAHLVQSQKLETVGKLAGGIAHEFNSILTSIIGQSELLLKELSSGSPLVNNVEEINRSAGRAATLTRQLLAYGRKQFLRPEILDLNRILEEMEDMLRHLVGSGVEILILNSKGALTVKADAGQIEQVIMNIAINAREAMPLGGKLTLKACRVSLAEGASELGPELAAGDYVTLAMTDTGEGMSEDVKARIFEPFFSTKAVGEGTGLGLSTCYGIVKQSGGHISVDSEPGRGSTFKIYLSQVEDEARKSRPSPAPLDLPRGTETILLVENDPALREMAATLLRKLGYTILAAANGVEALRLKMESGPGSIDLLFSDVIMPKMGGKELAERIKAIQPQTRVLFSSAYTENTAVHQGVLQKGTALLQKPFTPSALAHKLREVLDGPE